jgi:uncharacterized protein involved in exopolysaccharide biosynthesis
MDPTAGIRRNLATATFITRKIIRHWPWLVAGFVVAFGGVATYTFTRTDAYRSETLVQVAPAILADFVPGAEPSADDLKQRIHQLTLSRTRLEQVLGELQPYAGRTDLDSTEALLGYFRQRISIEMHGEDTFLLSFEHHDPAMAQAVTRRLAALFIEERSSARTIRVQATARLLGGQVAAVLDDLGRREDALSTFKEEHRADLAALRRPLTSPRSPDSIRVQSEAEPHSVLVGEAARAAQALRARRAAALAALRTLQSAAQTSPEVDALRTEIAELQRERVALLARFTSDYPTVAENTRRLAALQRRLAAVLAQPAQGPSGAGALELTQEIADLDAEIARMQREATRVARPVGSPSPQPAPVAQAPRMTLPEVEAQLEHLTAELATTREQHRQTTTRLFEAEFALSVESQRAAESVRVIDPANRPSRPFSPNRPKLLGAGAALALLLGLLFAFAAGVLDTRIFEEGDLVRAIDLPVLVTIPVYGRAA